MRIESRAIKLQRGAEKEGSTLHLPNEQAHFTTPEDAHGVNAQTVHTADGMVLLVTWLVPTTDDEKAEVAARKAQVRAAAGGILTPVRGMG